MIDIFSKHVIFDVDLITTLQTPQSRDGKRVRDQSDREQAVSSADHCQADAIHRDRTFRYQQAMLGRSRAKPEICPFAILKHVNDFRSAVHVALYKVTAKAGRCLE